MAEPVLLISSDPFLGASLEAVARGRLQIARLDPARRPPAWPASPSATVVLDVTARQRDPVHTWVRRHHAGPLVILLKPGERQPPVPPGPSTTVVARPFRLIELVALLERPPTPPAARKGDAEAVDAEGEREGEGEPPPVPLRAAGRLPRPDWPTAATRLAGRRPRRPRRGRGPSGVWPWRRRCRSG
ncbi:MAG TPA: hypothetical protein VHS79_16705, partial [Actinomycetes bacterium]|nr:hypothetical protein [Actinomycetes bacterium]